MSVPFSLLPADGPLAGGGAERVVAGLIDAVANGVRELPSRVTQTDATAGSGNALQACVASLLGLALDAVPNFVTFPSYLDAIRRYLSPREARKLALEDGVDLEVGRLCVLRGQSPRGDFGHVVVARWNGDAFTMEWDPHPDSTGLERGVPCGWVLYIDGV